MLARVTTGIANSLKRRCTQKQNLKPFLSKPLSKAVSINSHAQKNLNKICCYSIIDKNAVINTEYISLYLLSSPIKFSVHAHKSYLEREGWEKYFAL